MPYSPAVADLFTITSDLGPNAPLAAVAQVVADIQAVGQGATELAVRQADGATDAYIRSLLRRGGLRRVLDEARRRELPGTFGVEGERLDRLAERSYGYDFLLDELPFSPDLPRSRRRDALVLELLTSSLGGGPVANLLQQLRADYTVTQLPESPLRVRSLQYTNPFDAEILAYGAASVTALGFLLGVIRDWAPRRRREQARAVAEERIQAAAAGDAEDQAWFRAQIRRQWLARNARGGLSISPEDFSAILSDGLMRSIERLAEREIEVQRTSDVEA